MLLVVGAGFYFAPPWIVNPYSMPAYFPVFKVFFDLEPPRTSWRGRGFYDRRG